MKKIAIEEHFVPESYIKYLHSRKECPKRDYIEENGQRLEREWISPTRFNIVNRKMPNKETKAMDVGEGRLKDMDESGIDIQVLSSAASTVGFNTSENALMCPVIKERVCPLGSRLFQY